MPRRGTSRRRVTRAAVLAVAACTMWGAALLAPRSAGMVKADDGPPLRVAIFHTELTRRGPGLLLRDILSDRDPQVQAVLGVISDNRPDVLLLTGIDLDAGGHVLMALRARLTAGGLDYPFVFAPPSNAGMDSGADLDGNGRRGDADDAQGYGRFRGNGAMALLSRYPLGTGTRDLSALRWQDLGWADPPRTGAGEPFPDAATFAEQRLSSRGHWLVPVTLPSDGQISVLAFAATPPVFDGPEDRNGRRNSDETRLAAEMLSGAFGPPPSNPVVMAGINLDPVDGEGRRRGLRALLLHPALEDPAPRSPGAVEAARLEGGVNATQRGAPATDTVTWSDTDGPGNLRVDYILPAKGLSRAAGVDWPLQADPRAQAVARASRHRLVWVDLAPPHAPAPPDD